MKPLGLPDPRRIGPYRIFAHLGRGGMGRVFLAGAPDGRLVALKLVHAQHVEEPGFRERFRREVAASRRVSGAYTAPVVDADVETEIPWLVTVFVPGPSLRQAIDAAGPLPADTSARLAAGLATALAGIHAAGLVHRDLKPSNVLLAADGPRVIDFGVARVTDGHTSELTHTGWLVGSPGYMSPEQAESKPLTPASDIFSLGAVVYMACTGTEPFMGASTPATLYNVVHAEPDLEAVPEQLREVIAACLAKDPAARPTPEQVLALIGDVPAVTRTWPDAVHALIAEQDEAVVAALRDGGAPEDVAVVPLLPGDAMADAMTGPTADPITDPTLDPATGAMADTGAGPAEPPTTFGNRAPEDLTVVGDRGPRRPRRALTAVLGVAALVVGGTAAALVTTDSGASPSAASVQVSESAAPEPGPGAPSVASSAPEADTSAGQSDSPSAPPVLTNSGSKGTAAPSTDVPTKAASSNDTSPSPACLGDKQAYSLAEQKNGGTLPSDAKVSVLKCDNGWAAGQLTSVGFGNASIVYENDGADWYAVDLGTAVCGGVVRGAPSDVRKALSC
ncbi:protein kinase [Catenulispora sp. NF23]|uniref:serine/threonine-protein kinase n=1 Tax=Catenulispora pinistramenti TaxID=2705254 RepID=UPI001BA4C16F|nr:serine/threonine-protein kinase [Catenulispora pinistramenti]MBS2535926.1 protein kinase [Catenulispora pinistramenti]